MTTQRLYFTAATAGVVPAIPAGVWDYHPNPTGYQPRVLGNDPGPAQIQTVSSANWTNQERTGLAQQFVSGPLDAGTYSGTFTALVVMALNSNGWKEPTIRVFITDPTGATVRGVLGVGVGTRHSSLTFRPHLVTGTLSPVTAAAGDRLVVEVGAFGRRNSVGLATARQQFGWTTIPGDHPATEDTSWNGQATWIDFTWDVPPPPPAKPITRPRLFLGPRTDPVEVTGGAYSITARRGGSPDLPTPRLEPGWISATIGAADVRPDTHPEARPGRPVRLMLEVHDADDPDVPTYLDVVTGTLTAARIEYPGKLDDRMRVVLEAVDVLGVAAGIPSVGPLRGGRFADRIADVLDPAGLPAVVTDTTPPATGTRRILPGDPASVLEHLALVRDTTHGSVTTTRAGEIRATADRDRPALADPPEPAFLLTDAAMPPAGPTVIRYTDLQPDFDTTHLVNVVTVTTEGAGDATYSIPESVTEWGPAPAAVTVNEGRPGGHAARHMAERVTPRLTVTRVVYDATDDPRQAVTPELGDVCRIQRAGLVDDLAEVTAIEHTITATTRGGGSVRWSVALELRPLVIPPHRWADVPDTVTWADVPPALTWTTAAAWRP